MQKKIFMIYRRDARKGSSAYSPWHFIAVTNKDKLKEMAINNPNARMLEQAPLTIVVCGNMQKALEGEARALWVQDCSAATENILLAAHGLGLGAVWTALYLRDG